MPSRRRSSSGYATIWPGPVIGHLAAAIDRHDRDVARHQHVLPAAGLAEREDGIVLDHPELVGRFGAARVGERLHRAPDRFVGLAAELLDEDDSGIGIGSLVDDMARGSR